MNVDDYVPGSCATIKLPLRRTFQRSEQYWTVDRNS